jgi:hypothetical protein
MSQAKVYKEKYQLQKQEAKPKVNFLIFFDE